MTWKPDLLETKKRYINWWNHRGIVLNMWDHFQHGVKPHGPYAGESPVILTAEAANNYGTGSLNLPGAPVPSDGNQRWFDPVWRAEFLDWYVGHSCLLADMLPVANTQLGPGSLAAILGSRFEGGDDTIWIHPDPDYRDDFRYDPQHPNMKLHRDLLRAVRDRSKGNYYVGIPDLMEGLDVLAAMKGTDKVLMDTLTQPDLLEEQMRRINEAYFQVYDELYEICRFDGRDCGGDQFILLPDGSRQPIGTDRESAFCYFSAWAPGPMSKLQSDISTMLSEDDYRRFVQPFIREQTQRIDYTLYHLDGVGAMRHLPAILEIEDLNAIQWTPGVGQPQGGDPKWYELYRQILGAGKSILACWVTLDQLRPLLDNVGGDGVHLEMDFHNEDEVEQALRIIEEYQAHEVEVRLDECIRVGESTPMDRGGVASAPVAPAAVAPANGGLSVVRPALAEVARQRVLLLDGAMGTTLQGYDLSGTRGCNEYLCVERPEVIADIYRHFLAAGSDVISTNTFNAQSLSLEAHGLAGEAAAINRAAVLMARQLADAFTLTNPDKPRYVVGSVGPTRETLSMPETAHVTAEQLRASYCEQMAAQIEAGVDGLLIETIFDTVNCTLAIEAAVTAMKQVGREVPLMLSFSVRQADGRNMLGQDIVDYCRQLSSFEAIKTLGYDPILSVGINCNPDLEMVVDLTQRLAAEVPYLISAYPNAGLPDAAGHFPVTPALFAAGMWPAFDRHIVNFVGGCCGTTPDHIAALAPLAMPAADCYVTPHQPGEAPVGPVRYKRLTLKAPASPEKPANQESPAQPAPSAAPAGDPAARLQDAIVSGKQADALEATKQALAAGADPTALINEQMITAMAIVGQRFEEGTAFVPQLLMAGRAMKGALTYIKEYQAQHGQGGEGIATAGRIVIGTVKGDLHDIGKNLVASMLEGAGFEVINIGIDVDADTFVQAAVDNHADIICLSALLTTTMTYMTDVIEALKTAGIRDKVKVMVGGAPVSQAFADQVGADGYSENANQAVALAKRLMNLA